MWAPLVYQAPVTGHQAPCILHHSASPGTEQLSIGQKFQQAPGYRQSSTGQTVTGHQIADTRHRSSVTGQPVTGQFAVIIRYQLHSPGKSHRATRHESPGTSQFTRHRSSDSNDWYWTPGSQLYQRSYIKGVLSTDLGGSVGCAVRLEIRRSQVQPPPRSATFFHGDWSWNIFYGHSLPSADSRRAVVSFWRKNVHNTG